MAGHTVVATANVLCTLRLSAAREALGGILDLAPDLVGLQEWYPRRYRLLRETGSVQLLPDVGVRLRRTTTWRTSGYRWTTPVVGGCAVGSRTDRFELLECRSRILSWIGRSERSDHWTSIEPPRVATVGLYRDKHGERIISLVNFHLAPGVQAEGRYRNDRPVLVARHQHEVRNVQRLIDEQLALGHIVYAVGDSNYDGLRLAGTVSAWEGREGEPGTLGPRRHVDDVFGPGQAASVTLLTNASDHKAIVVDRPDM